MRNVLPRKRNSIASFWVSAHPRRPKVEGKASEAANLDSLTIGERIAHQLQNMLNRKFHILSGKMFLFTRN